MSHAVEEEYEALLQFLYLAPIGLAQTRLDGEIVLVNPLCAQLLMPLAADGQMANLFTVLQDIAPDLRSRLEACQDHQGMVCDAMQLVIQAHPPQRLVPQVLSLSLLKLDGERLMAVLSDVTQAVQRERALRQSQAWVNTLAVGLSDYALVSLDHRGCILDPNPSIARLTGFDAERTCGQRYALFYPEDAMPAERVTDRLREADHTGWSLDEGWRVRADGSRFWGSCLIAPLHVAGETSEEERAYSLIIRDVSHQRDASEALRRSVSCDHLTGLANRRAFIEAAELELLRWTRAPRPLSLLLLDVDHFKAINDRHGHAAGDAVLRHLAAALASSFRAADVVARIGGEAFVVLLPGTLIEDAEAVARRVLGRIASQGVEVEGVAIHCTVSAGVVAMAKDIDGVAGLLHCADAAMYKAKAAGRNRVQCWHRNMGPAALATLPT